MVRARNSVAELLVVTGVAKGIVTGWPRRHGSATQRGVEPGPRQRVCPHPGVNFDQSLLATVGVASVVSGSLGVLLQQKFLTSSSGLRRPVPLVIICSWSALVALHRRAYR